MAYLVFLIKADFSKCFSKWFKKEKRVIAKSVFSPGSIENGTITGGLVGQCRT